MSKPSKLFGPVWTCGITAVAFPTAALENGSTPATSHVSCGDAHTCVIKMDGTLACWGDNRYGQAPATAPGTFLQVAAGVRHTCALKSDSTIQCWGSNSDARGSKVTGQATPPDGRFTQLSAAGYHTCAVAVDGHAACWGDNREGESTPANGKFIQVSTGIRHTCGILTSGKVVCWGSNSNGQAPKQGPEGPFRQLSAGNAHTCGLRVDGSLNCWGDNTDGQAPESVQNEEFSQVTAGGAHTCALRIDGSVHCWGSNQMFLQRFDQSMPPSGTFAGLSAGFAHTCGFRTSGKVTCWGANIAMSGARFGQATVPAELASLEDAPKTNPKSEAPTLGGAGAQNPITSAAAHESTKVKSSPLLPWIIVVVTLAGAAIFISASRKRKLEKPDPPQNPTESGV